jgi:uncharacterized membrane protein
MVITIRNSTRLLAFTMLIALLSASLASMALAASSDNRAQPQAEDNSGIVSDGQTLYASEDNATTTSDDNPVLIQPRDNNANITNGDSSANPTEDTQSEEASTLIATQTTSDNTIVVIATIAVVAAIAVGASVAVVRRPKK